MSSEDNWRGPYGLVIYTDKYAGNFVRELCAYTTGHVGECEVGDREAQTYFEDYYGEDKWEGEETHAEEDPLYEAVQQVADDNGCYRPSSIWNDANCQERYTALIIYFEKLPARTTVDFIVNRAKEFRPDVNILGHKVLNRVVTETTTEMEY